MHLCWLTLGSLEKNINLTLFLSMYFKKTKKQKVQ